MVSAAAVGVGTRRRSGKHLGEPKPACWPGVRELAVLTPDTPRSSGPARRARPTLPTGGSFPVQLHALDGERSVAVQRAGRRTAEPSLWGINAGAQNRERLAPGDEVVVYVGVPERAFIGHAVLSSAFHAWTTTEDGRYRGELTEGVPSVMRSSRMSPSPCRMTARGFNSRGMTCTPTSGLPRPSARWGAHGGPAAS